MGWQQMTLSRKVRRERKVKAEICEVCGLTNIIVKGFLVLCIHQGGTNYNSDINWTYQNKLRQEWLAANPDAQYIGWTSI